MSEEDGLLLTHVHELQSLYHLVEPPCLALFGSAILIVTLAAFRALRHDQEAWQAGTSGEDIHGITLQGNQVVLMPIASSCVLLLIYYFFTRISFLMMMFVACAAAAAVGFAVAPLYDALVHHLVSEEVRKRTLSICGSAKFTPDQVLLGLIGVLTALAWLVTGDWLLNNVLGSCLCIGFVSVVRLPNVRVCSILLGCLFLYDIFWVFISESIFGSNMMLSAATKQATNPLHSAAEALRLPIPEAMASTLDLPVKLLFPTPLFTQTAAEERHYLMLGLGDVALPGMLLALLLCHDCRKHDKRWHSGYMVPATAGYLVGLVVALGVGIVSSSAQPALLYLVPGSLGPVLIRAAWRQEFRDLWYGPRPAVATATGKCAEV